MEREDQIRLIAYRIWEEEGRQNGRDCDHWFRAEAVWEQHRDEVGVPVGNVGEFFARPVVAGIRLTAPVKIGDILRIKGHTTDLEFVVGSMQIEKTPVQEAQSGDNVGIKVPAKVRVGDSAYKISRPQSTLAS
jgi:hypothetical protein